MGYSDFHNKMVKIARRYAGRMKVRRGFRHTSENVLLFFKGVVRGRIFGKNQISQPIDSYVATIDKFLEECKELENQQNAEQNSLEKGHGKVITVDPWTFSAEIRKIDKPIVLSFIDEGCSSCRKLDEQLASIAQQYAGAVEFRKIKSYNSSDLKPNAQDLLRSILDPHDPHIVDGAEYVVFINGGRYQTHQYKPTYEIIIHEIEKMLNNGETDDIAGAALGDPDFL